MNKELYELMENILYNEIIPECKLGNLMIGDINPAISFTANIEGKKDIDSTLPCLVINDTKIFNKYMYDYVLESIKFYYDGLYSHDNIKSVISYLIANLTDIELSNPIGAIISRTNMLKENISKNINTSFLDYDCCVSITKLAPYLETPYSFNAKVIDEDDTFNLPSIMFGIDGDKCIIYAMQNKDNSNNKLKKKLNRLFYKFNDKVEDSFDSDNFNISDITMSFVASIIMFINYLNENNINKIEVKVNAPIRYNNHFEANERRLRYKEKVLSDSEYQEYKKMIERQNEAYKDNITLKLLRTFYRVCSYGDVLNVNTMPFSVSDSMKLTINDEGIFNNDLCNMIYKSKLDKKDNYLK